MYQCQSIGHFTSFTNTSTAALEFVVFYPPNGWIMGQSARSALVVSNQLRGYHMVRAFQDPGHGYQNIYDNHIHPDTRFRVDSLGDIIYRLNIPLAPGSDFRTVVDLLESLDKVNMQINPGGLFPWTFGNFVRRALQKLCRRGHIIVSASHPILPGDEYLYDMYIRSYLGTGNM